MAKQIMTLETSLVEGLFQRPEVMSELVKMICQAAMSQEVQEKLGASRHERSEDRSGYRNGYKPRTLKTRIGELEIEVPQVRGCDPYHPSLFGKWQRSERALLVACAEMYFQGVSTRNVTKVLEVMCDGEISATTVSCVARELDEKISAFRKRRLDGQTYPYVKVDARYESVRVNHKVVTSAVLVVIGYTGTGRREILDWRLADSESDATWSELFASLKNRGLQGVKLLVSDAHKGIIAGARRYFQNVPWQRCQVHFKREIRRKVNRKERQEVMNDVLACFAGATRQECLSRAAAMADRWERRHRSVARMMREGFEDCLSVIDFPQAHRIRLASTNDVEIIMKQIKKRTQVVGVFCNESSCDRLVGAQLLEIHEQWQAENEPKFKMELED